MSALTPAQELSAAAEKIRKAAKQATYRPGRWSVDVAGPAGTLRWLGPSHDALTATWMQAVHVNLWSPAVAELVAELLAAAAGVAEEEGALGTNVEVVLAEELRLARAICGEVKA